MEKIDKNCCSKDFSEYLSHLSQDTPIADAYGDRDSLGKEYPADNQHEIQKKHIVTWFKLKDEMKAEYVYNCLKDPTMLIWIAESFNVNKQLLEKAVRETGHKYNSGEFGITNGKTGSSLTTCQATIIRQILTWDVIWDINMI